MRFLMLAIAAVLISSMVAHAQVCTPVVTGAQSGPLDVSQSSPVFIGAMMPFDDGSGPALVVAGKFAVPPMQLSTSSTLAARYRNGVWSSMGAGLPLFSDLGMRALAVADFSAVGGPGRSLYTAGDGGIVYRWTGSQWTAVSTMSGGCSTLLFYTDAQGLVLLAGGAYAAVGVMAWRGTGAWVPYAPLSTTTPVLALRVVDDGTGPALFALGSMYDAGRNIRCIAKYAGGQWTSYPVAVSFPQAFTDLASFDNGTDGPELYLAGMFGTPQFSGVGVARLHAGVWGAVSGTPPNTNLNVESTVIGPTFFKVDEGQGEQLYVGGVFERSGVNGGLVKLAPNGWQAPVVLTSSGGSSTPYSGAVHAIARFDDGQGMRTYYGGAFRAYRTNPLSTNEYLPAYGLIRSTDNGFESTAQGLGELPSGTSQQVRYMLSVVDIGQGPRLFAGAPFGRAGGTVAGPAALFDGVHWTSLSLPPNFVSTTMQYGVVANILGQPRLVTSCYNSTALGPIAYWDGAQWVRLPTQPFATVVFGMAVFNGTLYVLLPAGLSYYTGTSWVLLQMLGSNTGGGIIAGDIGHGQRLYAVMSGPSGQGLYEFDGATFTLLHADFNSNYGSIAIHDDGAGPELYVAAPGVPGYVARLQNSTLVPLGPGFSVSGQAPLALASFDDGRGPALYIAGPFTNAGGTPVNGLARWHAGVISSPTPFVQGMNPTGLASVSLQPFGNRLYIAGQFYNIGGVAADHFAYIEACPHTCSADFNNDGDVGTDADIDAFFACLSGTCCAMCGSADFNGDGDIGTDQDIDSFFRVLGGGAC